MTYRYTGDLNMSRLSTITKRKVTQRQKIKYFQSDEGGGAAIDRVNEFIEIALNTKNTSQDFRLDL
jgi:hypothetical protein